VKLILKEKGLDKQYLDTIEYLKYKYEVSLMLLCELGDKQ